jgi:predicted site-specific integrase-resolvase
MTETEWLTQQQVADRLQVSRRTVERWRKGDPPLLPTYRTPGGDPRFHPADVANLLTLEGPTPGSTITELETPAP